MQVDLEEGAGQSRGCASLGPTGSVAIISALVLRGGFRDRPAVAPGSSWAPRRWLFPLRRGRAVLVSICLEGWGRLITDDQSARLFPESRFRAMTEDF